MAAEYVRAVYDFDASHPDEVSLRKGDVVKIIKKLDANCMFGILHQVEGSFPANIVEPLIIPPAEAGQRTFAAIGNFDGGEMGDLSLKKGDIVIGTVAVDQNWWEGFEISSRNVGIFPLTHVEELNIELRRNSSFQDEKSSHAVSVTCEAVVISSFHAQLEGELDLTEGETVESLQILNDGYAFGCCRGKTGKFPLSHVQVRDPKSKQISVNFKSNNKISVDMHNSNISHNQTLNSSSAVSNNGYLKGMKSHARKGSYTQASTTSHDSYVTPYAQACFAFTAVNEGELSFAVNEIIALISHINDDWAEGEINGRRGIFPTSYVNIIVDCELAEDTKLVQAADAAAAGEEGLSDMYGRVLCDFVAENSSELSLCEGDTVTILKQVDADWYLARHDDERVGRCPVNHIEVFGCEPLHSVTTPSSVLPDKELGGEHAAVNKISSFNTIVKPKPAVKPKPKLNSSGISHCGSATTSSERDGTKQNPNFVSEEIQKEFSLSHNSHHALELQKHHPNTPMNLDQVVQFESQRIGETKNAGGGNIPKHQCFNAVNIQELKATEPFRTKQDSSRMLAYHQSIESPVAMPRIRPNTLGTEGELKGKADKNKNRPTPPLRPSESRLSAGKPKIIPKRPAPPLPASRTAAQSRSHNDLMMLSPNTSGSSDPLVTRRSAPMMQPSMNSPTSPVHPDAVKSDSKQADKNHSEKRQRVIAELVQTESDYVNCLVLCLKTFSSRAQFCPPTLDLEMLFGNADEVVELSQRLLGLIELNVETKPFETQCVGKCFTELKEQFQQVYALYCRNHDDVIALLEKYEGNAEISKFIQAALDQVRQQVQVFDLHSILIKPVQRILKYPLLLNELERVTDEMHADKHHLLTAINTMTCVAAYINEYKRRKDLVFKYKHETDVRFSDKIGRLTMHSTMKKLSRISRKMVGIQTVDEVFNHEEQRFKALDSAVRNLTKDISQYIDQCHEVLGCRDLVTANIAEFYTKEAPEPEIQKLCEIHSQILRDIFQKFKEEVESDILPPLNSLLLMYQGPLKIIRKRYDKLLDYDNAAARQRSAGDSDQAKALDEELTVARNNYEALNAQLLDDLPKLYSLSMEILLKCLRWFIGSQNRFLRNAVDKLHALRRLPLLLGSSSSPNIVEAFNIAHSIAVEKMSDLSFITKSFNPQVDEVRKMKGRRSTIDGSQKLIDIEGGSNQCDGQRIQLKQKYPAEQLFWVCRDFLGAQTMDLVLSAGALVAVIKESDPMGNRDRWFVDNGAEKGFVPKEFLSDKQPSSGVFQNTFDPFEWLDPAGPSESKSSKANDDLFLLPTAGNCTTQILRPTSSKQTDWVKCDDDPLPSAKLSKEKEASASSSNFNDSQLSSVSSDVFYRAVYDFNARSSIELSMRNGEIVHVLQKHDLDGSEEWWQVEREDGQKGYVPANYLYAFHYS